MKKIGTLLLTLVALAFAAAPSAAAQNAACASTYTVKPGDWLSKIAAATYENLLLYPKIVEATNAADPAVYARIADPNRIEVGWKLCLPPIDPSKFLLVTYDFRTGANGWQAGFADYPPGQEKFYELQSALRELPDVAPTRPSYFISGNNHSDDLYMFLKKQLTARDGIKPNTTYSLKFKVVVASNAPSGCMGVGGAPGEGVTLKAGASAIEPKPVDQDGMYRMNVDKGNQTQGGPAGAVMGDIANGLPCDTPSATPYVSLTRERASEYPVKSSAQGDLWLLVGTDSGFEATTALYYQQIQVELTAQ